VDRSSSPNAAQLLAAALDRDSGRPLVTYYDDSTGERVELSTASFANWVAKTANLIVDGLGREPGDVVGIDLPRHWIAGVWALAAWSAGLRVLVGDRSTSSEAEGVDVAVRAHAGHERDRAGRAGELAASSSPAWMEAADDLVVVSLLPLGAPPPAGSLPAGATDYAREVPSYGDRFVPVAGSEPSLLLDGAPGAGHEAALLGRRLAADWQLGPGGRLLVAERLDPVSELLAASMVPLVVGGSVVLCAHPDDAVISGRAAAERVSASAGSRP
jgi:uncharacterized protein (TIGR03089 family)